MADLEVHVSLDGDTRAIGRVRSQRSRGKETLIFEYAESWLTAADRFPLEPALPLTRGVFAPGDGRPVHGAVGDSAPDTWGRRLMQLAERRQAQREGREFPTFDINQKKFVEKRI